MKYNLNQLRDKIKLLTGIYFHEPYEGCYSTSSFYKDETIILKEVVYVNELKIETHINCGLFDPEFEITTYDKNDNKIEIINDRSIIKNEFIKIKDSFFNSYSYRETPNQECREIFKEYDEYGNLLKEITKKDSGDISTRHFRYKEKSSNIEIDKSPKRYKRRRRIPTDYSVEGFYCSIIVEEKTNPTETVYTEYNEFCNIIFSARSNGSWSIENRSEDNNLISFEHSDGSYYYSVTK